MQVVNVLSDDAYFKLFLKLAQSMMPIVGLNFSELRTSLVVKSQYQFAISSECFRGSYFMNVIVLPKTIVVSESFYSTFSRDSCSCKYYNVLSCHVPKIGLGGYPANLVEDNRQFAFELNEFPFL